MKFCNKCGKQHEDNAKFCANCGNSFDFVPKNKSGFLKKIFPPINKNDFLLCLLKATPISIAIFILTFISNNITNISNLVLLIHIIILTASALALFYINFYSGFIVLIPSLLLFSMPYFSYGDWIILITDVVFLYMLYFCKQRYKSIFKRFLFVIVAGLVCILACNLAWSPRIKYIINVFIGKNLINFLLHMFIYIIPWFIADVIWNIIKDKLPNSIKGAFTPPDKIIIGNTNDVPLKRIFSQYIGKYKPFISTIFSCLIMICFIFMPWAKTSDGSIEILGFGKSVSTLLSIASKNEYSRINIGSYNSFLVLLSYLFMLAVPITNFIFLCSVFTKRPNYGMGILTSLIGIFAPITYVLLLMGDSDYLQRIVAINNKGLEVAASSIGRTGYYYSRIGNAIILTFFLSIIFCILQNHFYTKDKLNEMTEINGSKMDVVDLLIFKIKIREKKSSVAWIILALVQILITGNFFVTSYMLLEVTNGGFFINPTSGFLNLCGHYFIVGFGIFNLVYGIKNSKYINGIEKSNADVPINFAKRTKINIAKIVLSVLTLNDLTGIIGLVLTVYDWFTGNKVAKNKTLFDFKQED